MTRAGAAIRLFVSFPEELVERPMIYELVKRFDVVPEHPPGQRRIALGLGDPGALRRARRPGTEAIAYLEGLGCTVNRMEGDVVAG